MSATRYAKILTSGSPAEVRSITASQLPDIVGNNKEFLIFADNSGKFHTSSRIYFTGSNGGQLVAEDINLEVSTITASGLPDDLTDRASIIFVNDEGGFETTSSLRYVQSSNALAFDGVYSGSFTGDGSGLTGVIGNTANPLFNGPGIGSASDGGPFEWDGSAAVQIQVVTASLGGLEFDSNSGLKLATSLAGDGLTWSFADDYTVMQIDLNGTSNGTSGLKLTSDGLALSDNIDGNGINFLSGQLRIDLANSSGLVFAGGELQLNSSLAGNGLTWANSYSELEIDTTRVVTSSNNITFKTGSTNLTLSATSDGTVTSVAGGFRARLIDNPVFTYDLPTTLTGNFAHSGTSFTINNDLTVIGDTVAKGTLDIQDPFMLISSGNVSDAGLEIYTGTATSAYLYYDSTTERWGVSNGDMASGFSTHDIFSANNSAINTTQIVTATENIIVGLNPVFGNTDLSRVGQMIVTSNPGTGESPLFIFA